MAMIFETTKVVNGYIVKLKDSGYGNYRDAIWIAKTDIELTKIFSSITETILKREIKEEQRREKIRNSEYNKKRSLHE